MLEEYVEGQEDMNSKITNTYFSCAQLYNTIREQRIIEHLLRCWKWSIQMNLDSASATKPIIINSHTHDGSINCLITECWDQQEPRSFVSCAGKINSFLAKMNSFQDLKQGNSEKKYNLEVVGECRWLYNCWLHHELRSKLFIRAKFLPLLDP